MNRLDEMMEAAESIAALVEEDPIVAIRVHPDEWDAFCRAYPPRGPASPFAYVGLTVELDYTVMPGCPVPVRASQKRGGAGDGK